MGYNFPKNIVFHSLKINLVLVNSAEPDKMPPSVAFYQGLHCLPKYPFMGIQLNSTQIYLQIT